MALVNQAFTKGHGRVQFWLVLGDQLTFPKESRYYLFMFYEPKIFIYLFILLKKYYNNIIIVI